MMVMTIRSARAPAGTGPGRGREYSKGAGPPGKVASSVRLLQVEYSAGRGRASTITPSSGFHRRLQIPGCRPIIRAVMKVITPVLITLIVCAAALAGAWLWMTPYRYEMQGAVRIHRLTGKTEIINQERVFGRGTGPAWLPMDGSHAPQQAAQ
jgi:hypothetical protein